MNSQQKLLTIGQIAKMIGITRRIIINYEDHGLIRADSRGEFNSGYRYYSMDTFVRIRTIRSLQNIGLSLEEIKNYLNDTTDMLPILRRMEALREELDKNIAFLWERMQQGEKSKIHITQLPPHTAYYQTIRSYSIEERTTRLRDVAYAAVNRYGMNAGKRTYFTEVSVQDPELVTYYADIPEGSTGEQVTVLPQVNALIQYHYGSYEGLLSCREKLLAYAREQGIRHSGVFRNIYLEGPPQHKDPSRFITVVALLMDAT